MCPPAVCLVEPWQKSRRDAPLHSHQRSLTSLHTLRGLTLVAMRGFNGVNAPTQLAVCTREA
eukprot:scaffold626_cov409-Prasinococcus_capsulatus_cf.AAC.31